MVDFKPKEKMQTYSFKERPSIIKRIDKLAKSYNISRSDWQRTVNELALQKYETRTNTTGKD